MEEVNEVEQKARAMGWVPEEEWKGDPDRWSDADAFVERGENVLPILRERLDKSLNEITSLKSEMQEIKKSAAHIAEYNSRVEKVAYERATKEYEKQLNTIKGQMKKAVKEGDEQTYEELSQELDSLEKPEKLETPPDKNAPHPDFEPWINENPWFKSDVVMRSTAIGIEQDILARNPGLTGRQLFDAVTERVKELFPAKFENPNQKKPNAVESGGEEAREKPKGSKTFDDLPPEAKAAYKELKKDFAAMKKELTKEQYLKHYEWEKE